MLKLVPFHEGWITHDKLDLHAIYRRPSRVEDEYGDMQQRRDASGLPLWDLTSPLPIRKHNDWRRKGFEYVTLANAPGVEEGGALRYVIQAAKSGTLLGGTPRDYSQDPRTGGPWNLRKYQEGQQHADTSALDQLRADVAQFGWETVEQIRRSTEPGFRVPDALKPKAEPEAIAVPEAVPVGAGKARRGTVN